MGDKHTTRDVSEFDRRTLLTGLALASGIGVGFGSVVGDTRATTISKITGEERERTVREAINDDRTEKMLMANLPDGSEMTNAKVLRSSYAEINWRVVTATFEAESGTELTVFWSDHEETEPAATIVDSDDRDGRKMHAVETPTNGVIPIAINPCDSWNETLNPDCIVETGFLYAEEIVDCGRCAANIRDVVDSKPKSRKEILFGLARSAPSCGSCLVDAIQKYGEHGIPCELCVPEEEVGLDDEDSITV